MGTGIRHRRSAQGRIGELDDEDSGYGIVYFGTIVRHHVNAEFHFDRYDP